MSSSIAIPRRKQPVRNCVAQAASASSSNSSPAQDSYSSSASTFSSCTSNLSVETPEARRFGKSKIEDTPQQERRAAFERRPSLLGGSFTKSEHTVVNLGPLNGPSRLVTCVKSSQGFDWNPELFLPSYMDADGSELERRPDPVHDIVLTDEEAAALLP